MNWMNKKEKKIILIKKVNKSEEYFTEEQHVGDISKTTCPHDTHTFCVRFQHYSVFQ